MKIASRHPFAFGTALIMAAAAGLYGCKDFLEKAAEPQGTLDEATLASHARAHLAGYKQPHAYRFVDALPRTPNGKIQRRLLVEQVRDSLS